MIIALVIVIITILTTVTTTTITVASLGVGNITDGKPRISLIQEEDFSFSLYQTINGATIQIAGFDNIMEVVDYFNINDDDIIGNTDGSLLEESIDEEEIDDSDNNDNGNDNGNNNGDEPEPEPEPEPGPIETIEPGIGNGSNDGNDNGGNEEGGDEFAILTEGCFGGGYYSDDPDPRCYPINDDSGELETEPEPNTAYCAALGCLFNPPNISG